MRTLLRLSLVTALAGGVLASAGDRNPEYTRCTTSCSNTQCNSNQPLPLSLRLTGWTCIDDCKYRCTHYLTDQFLGRGEQVQQYYGKWPFWRFAGMQEPASVAFSLLNLWAHVNGVAKIRRSLPNSHPMKSYYLTWGLTSINAWIWSSVFHTRDLPSTEKLDYFSAALAIFYALYYTTIRVFHLYPTPSQTQVPQSSQNSTTLKRRALAWFCILVYLLHISYLTFSPRFDYSYNMAFSLVLGISHNLLWLVYSLPASLSLIRRFPNQPKTYRPSFVSSAAVFVGLTTAATALELFDFPPWGRIIDAHALWHLATVPIAVVWYDFLVDDSLDPSWREQKT